MEILGVQYQRVLTMLANDKDRVVALASDAAIHRLIKIEREGKTDLA